MQKLSPEWRNAVHPEDPEYVLEIVSSTGFFSQDEIDIAVELVTERLEKGIESGYHFLFAEIAGKTVGYSCFGPIPATQESFDLYWIAVHNDYRGAGIGKQLLTISEEAIHRLGGARVYIETSGHGQYESTRAFYLRCAYTEDAILDDFYAPGDAKYIYVKKI